MAQDRRYTKHRTTAVVINIGGSKGVQLSLRVLYRRDPDAPVSSERSKAVPRHRYLLMTRLGYRALSFCFVVATRGGSTSLPSHIKHLGCHAN
jgi:hypothetical protein